MRISTTSDKRKRMIKGAVAAIFWIGIWYAAALAVNTSLILPMPHEVIVRLGELVVTGRFWIKTGVTLFRIVSGLAIGLLLGVAMAVLSAVSEWARAVMLPVIRIVRATPVASFIILVMLWVGYSIVPIVIGAIIVMPVVYQNVYEGIRSTDRELLEMARAYRLSRRKVIRHIYIPGVRPYFLSAAVTSLGLAWKSGVAAEVLARPTDAIGSEIYFTKIYLEIPDLFAWTMVIIVLSLLLEKGLTALMGGGRR